ncbi:MAG: hypothetical protein Q7T03_04445 [Deltaproteobacteria bacterium]|nr:hypothetical protein [Deltaproteobacteria bacterium]
MDSTALQGALSAWGMWTALPLTVQNTIQSGGVEVWADVASTMVLPLKVDGDAFQQASVSLQVLLAGYPSEKIKQNHDLFPKRNDLQAAIVRKIATLLGPPSEGERYETALEDLRKSDIPSALWASLFLVLQHRGEEGLDFILEAQHFTKNKTHLFLREQAPLIFQLAYHHPELALPAMQLFNKKNDVIVFMAAAVLGRHYPTMAATIVENFESIFSIYFLDLIIAMDTLPPHEARAVFEILKPVFSTTFGSIWRGTASQRDLFQRQSRAFLSLVRDCDPMFNKDPQGTARWIAQMAGEKEAVRRYGSLFLGYFQQADLSIEQTLMAWGQWRSFGFDVFEKYRLSLTLALAWPVAVSLLGSMAFFHNGHSPSKKEAEDWISDLAWISGAPKTRRLFEIMVERILEQKTGPAFNLLVEVFVELAHRERLEEKNPLALLQVNEIAKDFPFMIDPLPNLDSVSSMLSGKSLNGLDYADYEANTETEWGDFDVQKKAQVLLKNYRALVQYSLFGHREKLNDAVPQIIRLLGRLGSHKEFPFERIEFALLLHFLARENFDTARCPNLVFLLRKDIQEREGDRGEHRGLFLREILLSLHLLGHPQRDTVAESVLELALTAPLRGHHNVSDGSPENTVLQTVTTLLTRDMIDLLKKFPLTDKGRDLLRRGSHIAKMDVDAEIGDEESLAAESIDTLFHGAEVDALSSSHIPALEAASPPDTAVNTTALAAVLSGGQGLAQLPATVDPTTGMMQIVLGDGTRLPVWHTRGAASAVGIGEARADWQRGEAGTFSEVQAELFRLDREAEQKSGLALIPAASASAMVVADRLSQAREFDSVQAMMKARWGKNPEDDLLTRLSARVSFEKGLFLFETALRSALGNATLRLETMADLNRHLPNVTTFDVALVSLTDRVPKKMLQPDCIVMPYRLTVTGIEWADEFYDLGRDRNPIYAVDPYQYMGVTGASDHTEYTYYSKPVRTLVQAVLKTRLSDRHFFTHLWNKHPESANAGLGAFKKEGQTAFLLNKEVMDLGRNIPFRPSDIVRLVGLLDRLPACLNTPSPAKIYFNPFAGGILFFNVDGEPIEYVPYHPYLQHEGMQEVHYGTEADESDDNTFAQEFLGEQFMKKLLDVVIEQTQGEASLIEEASIAFSARFSIHLPLSGGAFEAANFLDIRSLKMSAGEISALHAAFDSLPPFVLARAREGGGEAGLKTIGKGSIAPLDQSNFVREWGRVGEYVSADRAINFYHIHDKPFAQLDEEERQLFHDTILHEAGEALFAAFPEELQEEVMAVYPWVGTGRVWTLTIPEGELPLHLLTSYSSSNPRDLFCEAFMTYISHGPEFRERAKQSGYLSALYAWLKVNIFTTAEGASIEYNHSPEVSLAQLEGAIRRWEAEEGRRREEQTLLESHETALAGAIGDRVASIEGLAEAELEMEERQEALELGERATNRAEENGVKFLEGETWGEWEKPILKEVSNYLRENIFVALLYESNEERQRLSNILDDMVMACWEGVRNGSRTRMQRAIRSSLREVRSIVGRGFEINLNSADLSEKILEIVKEGLIKQCPEEQFFIDILSRFLLPGQFTAEDLQTFHKKEKGDDVALLVTVCRFVAEREARWRLEEKKSAELVGYLAVRFTAFGVSLGYKPIAQMFYFLRRGKSNIQRIAEKTDISPAHIEQIARQILSPADYRQLILRSEVSMLQVDLKFSLIIHLDVERQWVSRYGSDVEKPAELVEGIERIRAALDALAKGDGNAVQKAKTILKDRSHSAAVQAVAIDLTKRQE